MSGKLKDSQLALCVSCGVMELPAAMATCYECGAHFHDIGEHAGCNKQCLCDTTPDYNLETIAYLGEQIPQTKPATLKPMFEEGNLDSENKGEFSDEDYRRVLADIDGVLQTYRAPNTIAQIQAVLNKYGSKTTGLLPRGLASEAISEIESILENHRKPEDSPSSDEEPSDDED
jgi:hypothetical protein